MNENNTPDISNGVKFTKTIGHEKQKSMLLRAAASTSLAHAYALVGPDHIGKTTLALEFASMLGADPVLDVCLLDGVEPISIEQAREAAARLAVTPVGKYKAAVINADNLTDEAASALLKLLEEPPARSVIFLITNNFYSLLPTVASRVQKIMFSGKRQWDNVGAELQNYYQILESGDLVDRLQTAEKLATLEKPEVRKFVKFSMGKFCATPQTASLGLKLLAMVHDLERNVNLKLALDNLFLP